MSEGLTLTDFGTEGPGPQTRHKAWGWTGTHAINSDYFNYAHRSSFIFDPGGPIKPQKIEVNNTLSHLQSTNWASDVVPKDEKFEKSYLFDEEDIFSSLHKARDVERDDTASFNSHENAYIFSLPDNLQIGMNRIQEKTI
jgi:hypothetical protein